MGLDTKDLSEKMLSTHRTTQPKTNIREIAMQLCSYIRTLHCTIHQYKIWPMSFSPLHRKRQRNQSFRYNLNETEKQKIHNQRFMNNDNVCRVQQRPKRHWLPVTRRASSRRLQHIPYRLKCSMYMKPDIETRCFCLLFFFLVLVLLCCWLEKERVEMHHALCTQVLNTLLLSSHEIDRNLVTFYKGRSNLAQIFSSIINNVRCVPRLMHISISRHQRCELCARHTHATRMCVLRVDSKRKRQIHTNFNAIMKKLNALDIKILIKYTNAWLLWDIRYIRIV